MKKFFLTFATVAFFLSPLFTSCSDKDDNEVIDPAKYPYSSLTPEQQKTKLGDDANAFISKIDALSSSKAIELLRTFNALTEIDQPQGFPEGGSSAIIKVQDFYGKYTWNKTTNKWDKTASSDKLVFVLPATRTGTTNNGQIEITGIASNVKTDDGYQIPQQLDAILNVDNVQVGSIHIKATEVSDIAAPRTAEVKYVIDDYTLAVNATKSSTSKNVSTFKLMKGSEILLDGSANLVANLDQIIQDEDNVSSIGDGDVAVRITNNLELKGSVDFKNIISKQSEIEDKYDALEYYDEVNHTYVYLTDAQEKARAEELAAVVNQYSNVILASRADQTKIATVKMRAKKYEDTYTYWNGSQNVTYTDVYYEQVPVLFFNDNTSVDAEVYFSAGFNTVLNSWNSFVSKFGF